MYTPLICWLFSSVYQRFLAGMTALYSCLLITTSNFLFHQNFLVNFKQEKCLDLDLSVYFTLVFTHCKKVPSLVRTNIPSYTIRRMCIVYTDYIMFYKLDIIINNFIRVVEVNLKTYLNTEHCKKICLCFVKVE